MQILNLWECLFETLYLQIIPGEGGRDSQLFSCDLAKAYLKHAAKNNIRAKILKENPKRIEIELIGTNISSYFQREAGVHRIQRVPPTETRGRMQTSIVNVVLLSRPVNTFEGVDKNKVIISYYKDSGNGGQKRNKTLSGVRLQYRDAVITCCETRDQRKNKELAFKKLEEKLKEREIEKVNQLIGQQYQSQNQNKGKRGNYDRNYNFPRDEVVQGDLKTSLSRFMKGDFGNFYC